MKGAKQWMNGFVMFVRAGGMGREWDGHQITRKVSVIQSHGVEPRKSVLLLNKVSHKSEIAPGKGEGWSELWFDNVFTGRESCVCNVGC